MLSHPVLTTYLPLVFLKHHQDLSKQFPSESSQLGLIQQRISLDPACGQVLLVSSSGSEEEVLPYTGLHLPGLARWEQKASSPSNCRFQRAEKSLVQDSSRLATTPGGWQPGPLHPLNS